MRRVALRRITFTEELGHLLGGNVDHGLGCRLSRGTYRGSVAGAEFGRSGQRQLLKPCQPRNPRSATRPFNLLYKLPSTLEWLSILVGVQDMLDSPQTAAATWLKTVSASSCDLSWLSLVIQQ